MAARRCRLFAGLGVLLAGPTLGFGQATAIRPIAVSGQPAPGGGTFEHFTVEFQPVVAPINAKGQVAFFATLLRAPGTEGVFVADKGRIRKVAVEGDPAPGGGKLSGFGKHPVPAINEAGAVAFAAAVSGGRTVEGIFVAAGGRLRPVALAGDPAPGIPGGTFAALDSPALNDAGEVAFLTTVRRGRETVEALYVRSGGNLRKLVAQEDRAPAGGTFGGFGPPALNNNGTVAFGAVVEGRGVPGGLFVADRRGIRMVVGAGDPTPVGGIFFKFSERPGLSDDGVVAFNAITKEGPIQQAVFIAERDGVRKVAALGDSAPGGGVFSYFGLWPAVGAAGAVALVASVDAAPAPVAVFVAGATGLRKMVGIGQRLPDGKALLSFGLYPAVAIGPRGDVTFAVAPTATGEGAEGIFVATARPAD